MGQCELPISTLSGIGKVKAAAFERLGLHTLGDLIGYFPSRYENRGVVTPLADGSLTSPQSYILTVATSPHSARLSGGRVLTKFRAVDESDSVEIVYFNKDYIKERFYPGQTFRFYGRLAEKNGRYSITEPISELCVPGKALADLYAVYPLTKGLNSRLIRDSAAAAFEICKAEITETLPPQLLETHGLCSRAFALEKIHAPGDLSTLDRAARRLAFDEMLESALAARLMRMRQTRADAYRLHAVDTKRFYAAFPYAPTGAQSRAIAEIYADLCRGTGEYTARMSRILIGDVGSGKTFCAEAALYLALASGRQAVLMAPTEILATQHYNEMKNLFSDLGFCVAKLVGSMRASEKKKVKDELASGKVQLVVGTHALIEDDVAFSDAALVIVDEQHRFGMMQRAKLLSQCPHAHILVMSATPIPRTLHFVLYGDLAISKIDEMPAGRQKIDTYFVNESYRTRLNGFIRRQIEAGGQVYVVCPAIEPAADDAEDAPTVTAFGETVFAADKPPLKNAVEYGAALAKVFPEYRVAVVHGRLKADEKNGIMAAFAAGEIQILVSTTVIEVGVNVPRANLMIIENAERFGLSQLHQLRGRVGRGGLKSYCILVSDTDGAHAKERLHLLCHTADGFEIAERDLQMRGPGDLLGRNGAKQSGQETFFRMAALCNDPSLFTAAAEAAEKILAADPQLKDPAFAPLKDGVSAVLSLGADTLN
ncbi:MAG: ATP-dependent DNA helicase RecG [Clostridia bacterium]|nr:ATP-dependent DNA helicase RecG [Clostridia bacterium]